MSLSKGLAAALKTARTVRGMSQQDLGDAGDRKHLWLMENARSSPTLNKFAELAKALEFDPVTLLILSVAAQNDIPPTEVLSRVQLELEEFARLDGPSKLASHTVPGAKNSRTLEREKKLAAVQSCKLQGMTQKATAEKLGIARSTVNDMWRATLAAPLDGGAPAKD